MDLHSILTELKAAQEEFKQSERSLATAIFCQRVDKALDRIVAAAEKADYEHLVVGILIVIGSFNDLLHQLLDGPLLTQLLDRLFRQCARVVLDIKWQQCDKDTPSQQSFRTSLLTCHQLMAPRGYQRFSVLQTLMDNPWTHPVLSMVMGSEEDNEEGEGLAYIQAQDPEILKLRVELMQQENCDEFALNLCTWCQKHPSLAQDFLLRKTQFILLHRLNNIDRLQEECQTMGMEDSIGLIHSLLDREEHKELCTMLAQTFLVQNWIKPSDNDTKKELLQLWIKLQYQADADQDRFIASLWAVAKLSHSTQQLLLIIDAVREQCGDAFLQFCLDLCKFAINVDKGCWEKLKEANASGPKEELLARKQDMAQVCEKISHIVAHVSPKVSFCCALTAFSMTPTQQSLQAVRVAHQRRLQKDDSGRSQCCSNCATDNGQCLNGTAGNGGNSSDKSNRDVNVATLYEVERLCGTLRPAYLSSESDFSVLYSMCKQYLLKENGEAVKSALVRRRSASSVQLSPAGSVPAEVSLSAGVVGGLGSESSAHNAVPAGANPVVNDGGGGMTETVSHVGNLLSSQKRDASVERGIHDPGLSAAASLKNVVFSTSGTGEATVVQVNSSKGNAAVGGQTECADAAQQQPMLRQLSADTVQVLLRLIESGQISVDSVSQALNDNPRMSLQTLNDLIARENMAAQKLATSKSSPQSGLYHQQQAQLLISQQQQQQQNKQQALPGHHPREAVHRLFGPVLHKEKTSHLRSEVPLAAQSAGVQPARIVMQGQGLQPHTPRPAVMAPQQLAQPRVGSTQQSPASASAAHFLPGQQRPQDPRKAPAATTTQQVLQGLPQIGAVTLPTLHLTSAGGIQVTQPVHVMTFRQPRSVHSSGAGGVQNAQILMQSSAHMLTHLSGGSVVAAAQQPHILHLSSSSSSSSLANHHPGSKLAPRPTSKVQKLIPKAPGPKTVLHDSSVSSGSGGDITLGNRHYSINNLLFTGEQQNSAMSISLPDRLPEISVDSISDTLRALSDSSSSSSSTSSTSSQVQPKVSVQLAHNPVSQALATAQKPRISSQTNPRQLAPKASSSSSSSQQQQQLSRSKKAAAAAAATPKTSAAAAKVMIPPTPSPAASMSRSTQALATLASFAVSAEQVRASSEQTLPSFSSLFSSSSRTSPLPVPKASTETVTTSTITTPLSSTISAGPHTAAASKKGAGGGQGGRGQKKGANKDAGKGAKKDKKALTSSKEEMMRLLKQAMSLDIRKEEEHEERRVMTVLHHPSQEVPPPHPPPPPPPPSSHTVADLPTSSAVSSASVWMVDFPNHTPSSVSREVHHHLQPSSQAGLPVYNTTAAASSYQGASSAVRHHHHNSAAAAATALSTRASPPVALAPPVPASVSAGRALVEVHQIAGQFTMPERRDSKLYNMLQKGESRQQAVSALGGRDKHHAASYSVPVCRPLGNVTDALASRGQSMPGAYSDAAAVLGSSVRRSASSNNAAEAVAAGSSSVKHPPLPYVRELAAAGRSHSQKDPSGIGRSDHVAGGFASWNAAVGYPAGRSAVGDMPGTAAVAWSSTAGNPAVVASGHPVPRVTANPAIPSVIYDDISCLSGTTASSAFLAAQSMAALSAGPVDSDGVNSSWSQSLQQRTAGAFPAFVSSSQEDGSVKGNRAGKKSGGNATYRCLICSKPFDALDDLRVHVKRNCKPPPEDPLETVPSASGNSVPAPSSAGGLETSTVFQCMRCYELCISEEGIRAHRQVCSKPPTPKPKAKPKSRAKPKQPKSEEEQAEDARVMELLNRCLGKNREILLRENEAVKAKKEKLTKKKPSKRKTSVEGQSDLSNEAPSPKKPKKEKMPAQSGSSIASPVDSKFLVPTILQLNQPTPVEALDTKPAVEHISAGVPPPQPTIGIVPTGNSQIKEEKPKPKRKYYPKKKKVVAADPAAESGLLLHPKKEATVGPGSASKGPKPKKPASSSNKQPKPKKAPVPKPQKPKKEAPPRPRFKELSGSGGRTFFKCLNCGQTLCSIENFNDHWAECIKKKPLVVKPTKRSTKEKKPKASSGGSSSKAHSSTTYSSQASIDAIIQSVASGSFASDMPDHEQIMNFTSEDLVGNPDTASYLEITSAASPIREDSEGDRSKLATTTTLLPSSDAVNIFANPALEQGDRTFEGYRSQASVENASRERESVVRGTGHPAMFFQTGVGESSSMLHGQREPPAHTSHTASMQGSYPPQPVYVQDSRPVPSDAAAYVNSNSEAAHIMHFIPAAPPQTTPFSSVPSSRATTSDALFTQADALSLPATVGQPVSCHSRPSETMSIQQRTEWGVLSSHAEATGEPSVPKMQSEADTITPQTLQADTLSSQAMGLVSVFQEKAGKPPASQTTMSETVSSRSFPAHPQSLQQTGIEPQKCADGAAAVAQSKSEASGMETGQVNPTPSTPAKPETKARGRPPKKPSGAQKRSQSAPKGAKKMGEKQRSNSAPRPALEDTEEQSPVHTDSGEVSGDFATSPQASVTDDGGESSPAVSPKKPSEPPPQDIKDVKYCKLCDRYYSRHWALVRHFAGQHVQAIIQVKEDSTSHFCPFCDSVFPQKHLFRAHVMLHADMLLQLFLDEESLALGTSRNTLTKQASPRRGNSQKIKPGSEQTSQSKSSTSAEESEVVGEGNRRSGPVPHTPEKEGVEAGSKSGEEKSPGGPGEENPVSSAAATPVKKSARKPKPKKLKAVDADKPKKRQDGKGKSLWGTGGVKRDKEDSSHSKPGKTKARPRAHTNNTKDKLHPLQIPEILQLGKFCRLCQRSFDRNWLLMQHMVRQHVRLYTTEGEGQKLSYCCDICHEVFANKAKYMEHAPPHYKIIVQEFNRMELPASVRNRDPSQTNAKEQNAVSGESVASMEVSEPQGEDSTGEEGRISNKDTASDKDDIPPSEPVTSSTEAYAADTSGKPGSQVTLPENPSCVELMNTEELKDSSETSPEAVSTDQKNDTDKLSAESVNTHETNVGETSAETVSTDEKTTGEETTKPLSTAEKKDNDQISGEAMRLDENNKDTPERSAEPTEEKNTDTSAEFLSTSKKSNNSKSSSSEASNPSEKKDNSETAQPDRNNQKSLVSESPPSSPQRSVTRNLAASLKKTNSEEDAFPVSQGQNEDRAGISEETIDSKACVEEAVPVEASGQNVDSSGEHVESIPPTVTESKKPESGEDAVGVSVETNGNSDSAQQPPENKKSGNKNTGRSSAASSAKSDSTAADSPSKRRRSEQLQKKISKRKDALKRKRAGIQNQGKGRNRRKLLSGSPQDHYCRVCHRFFCRNWVLAQHITSQHLHPYTMRQTRDGTTYRCHLCQKSFCPRAKYMYHVTFHAHDIIENFNSTDSLKEISFGGRSYRITTDASDILVAGKPNHASPPANLKKAVKDSQKKRGSLLRNTGSSTPVKSSRTPVKNASTSKNKRKTARGSLPRSVNSVSSDTSQVQAATESPRENGKRKSAEPLSVEQKAKRARTEKLPKAKAKNRVKKPDKLPKENKGNVTSEGSPREDKDQSDKSAGNKEEGVKEEADAAASESKAYRTRSEKANLERSEDCSGETSIKPEQMGNVTELKQPNDTELKEPKPETLEAMKETSDEPGPHQTPDEEDKGANIESLVSDNSKSGHVEAEDAETDAKANKLEEKSEHPNRGAVPASSGTENSTPHQNCSSKDGSTDADAWPASSNESDSAKESSTPSGVEEKTVARASNASSRGRTVVEKRTLTNLQEDPISFEPLNLLKTNPQKPSFLDSFKNFVNTMSSKAPPPINRTRKRSLSGNAGSTTPQNRLEKAVRQKRGSKEWPAAQSPAAPPPVSSAVKTAGVERVPAETPSTFGVTHDPATTVLTRTRRRSVEHVGLTRRKSEEPFPSECSPDLLACDSLPAECTENGSSGRDGTQCSEAAEVRKEHCSSAASEREGSAATLACHTGQCGNSGKSASISDSVPSSSKDWVKVSDSVPKPPSGDVAQQADAQPGATVSKDIKKTVHGSDDALTHTSPFVSEGIPEASEKKVHQTDEKREESPTGVATACEGKQQEVVTVSHSTSSDTAHAACYHSAESGTGAEKTNPLPSEKAAPYSCHEDVTAERTSNPTAGCRSPDITLTGILDKAIDLAYQQVTPSTVASSPFILPSLFTAPENISSSSATVSSKEEEPAQVLAGTVSSGGVSDRQDISKSMETWPTKLAPVVEEPISAVDDGSVNTSPRSGLPSPDRVRNRQETSTSSRETVLSDSHVQHSSNVMESTFSPDCAERKEEESFAGKDAISVLSTSALDLNRPDHVADKSSSDFAAKKQCLESDSESYQKGMTPVAAPEPSETLSGNQISSSKSAVSSGISTEPTPESGDIDDAKDTSNDLGNVVVLSKPQQRVESESRKDVLEEQESRSNHREFPNFSQNDEQKVELRAESESDVEDGFALEDDDRETAPQSPVPDPSSPRNGASVSSDTLSSAAQSVTTTTNTLSLDRTNSAKEDGRLESSTQSMRESGEGKNSLQPETVAANKHSKAAPTSYSSSIGRRKMAYDIDADTDLPDLCIETDPQSRIICPRENRNPESVFSYSPNKSFRKGLRYSSSGESRSVAAEKRNASYTTTTTTTKHNSDVVVSTVVGEYEVTVRKLGPNKSSALAVMPHKTYCSQREVVQPTEMPEVVKEAEPTEPVRKPMLGVKPLRSVLQPEPFVWDEENEVDGKRQARNQRSLRAFQQQVNVAPFMWDVEGGREVKGEKGKKASQVKVTYNHQKGIGADKPAPASSTSVENSCSIENANCDDHHSQLVNTKMAELQNSDDKDSDYLQTNNVNNVSSGCEKEFSAKSNGSEEAEERDSGSDKSMSTRRNKTELNKLDIRAVSAAVHHHEGGSGDTLEKMTRARVSLTQEQFVTHARTLRSGSSEPVRKRPRVSLSRERKNDSTLKRPLRKSRSCDIDSGHSTGTDSEVSLSTRSSSTDLALEEQPRVTTGAVTIKTRSRPRNDKSKLYTRGQKFAQHKYGSKFDGQIRNRSGLRSGLNKNSQRKVGRPPGSGRSGTPNSHENSRLVGQHSLSNSSAGKPRLRDRSLEKTDRERSLDKSDRERSSDRSDRDRSLDKTDSHQTTKPSSKQDSSKPVQPESVNTAAANCGMETKVLRSRDITPDKGASSVSQPSLLPDSPREGKTRGRRPSGSSPVQAVSEDRKSDGGKNKSHSSVERRGKGAAHKLSGSQPNLSAMVRRRKQQQQHSAGWHKATSPKPAKKRQQLSPQAPQYEIFRVEPLKEDSALEHRRTRSSDREEEPSPRTVHTRVSVDAVKPGLHNSSRKAPGDQKWSMKRHLTPADIRKKSADPRFPFSFKRAKRKTDSK